MILAELAALAAKVEGFVRPFHKCARCNGRGEFFHDVLHDDVTCAACDGAKGRFDNSPAALLMAVARIMVPHLLSKKVRVVALMHEALVETRNCTDEDIARAALVALLRAHGVEVADEP